MEVICVDNSQGSVVTDTPTRLPKITYTISSSSTDRVSLVPQKGDIYQEVLPRVPL